MSEEKTDENFEITSENFDEYFHDVRRSSPQKGEIMVCYSAMAEFIEGNEKRHIIHLIQLDGKIEPTTQVMRKLLFASELDAYRVPKAMLTDLISGMSEEEVLKKPYKYKIEIFYYTKPECVPKDDPHWTTITMLNIKDIVASVKENIDRKFDVYISSKSDDVEGFEDVIYDGFNNLFEEGVLVSFVKHEEGYVKGVDGESGCSYFNYKVCSKIEDDLELENLLKIKFEDIQIELDVVPVVNLSVSEYKTNEARAEINEIAEDGPSYMR